MNSTIWKKPSAWIPIVLSLLMLAIEFVLFVLSGPPVSQQDEGTAAHLFQIWLILEIVMIGFFAIKCLPQQPKQALIILATQILAVFVVCFPVFYFQL